MPEAPTLLVPRDEAARLLSVSPRTIDAMIRRGELNRVPIGRRVLVDRSDLERFIEAAKQGVPATA
jgi:excisionase family DNA binding protein